LPPFDPPNHLLLLLPVEVVRILKFEVVLRLVVVASSSSSSSSESGASIAGGVGVTEGGADLRFDERAFVVRTICIR
jgi:hypothetical protein